MDFFATGALDACTSDCGSASFQAAGSWLASLTKALHTVDAFDCPSGQSIFGGGSCATSEMDGACDLQCCNAEDQGCQGVWEVGAHCDPPSGGMQTCTCTESPGAAVGRTFSVASCAELDSVLWDECGKTAPR
jgi:hypothetical protein